MKSFKLFSGSSNLALAEKLSRALKIPLGETELTRFADGELRVRLLEDLGGKTVFLLQSFSGPVEEHFFEFCLMVDSARRLGAEKIIGVIPWLGYSKQDKEFRKGEAVSVSVMAKMISLLGLEKILVFDLHSALIKDYFTIPVLELSSAEVLYKALKEETDLSRAVVVSPDKGGKGRAGGFAEKYRLPIVFLEKSRDLETGAVTYKKVGKDLREKTAVIYDDIVNRGGTAIEAAKILKSMGAEKVIILATHAVLAGNAALNLQSSLIDKIFLTDTIAVPAEKQFTKLKIVSVAAAISHDIISS